MEKYKYGSRPEKYLLSAILINNNTMFDVDDILSADDFWVPAHRKIYAAMSSLFAINEPIDLITLSNCLSEKNILDEIGGATYLASLVNTVPLAVNPKEYASIIHKRASIRFKTEKIEKFIRGIMQKIKI